MCEKRYLHEKGLICTLRWFLDFSILFWLLLFLCVFEMSDLICLKLKQVSGSLTFLEDMFNWKFT